MPLSLRKDQETKKMITRIGSVLLNSDGGEALKNTQQSPVVVQEGGREDKCVTSAAELLSFKPQSVKTRACTHTHALREGESVISPAVQQASVVSLTLPLFVVGQQRVVTFSARH